MVGPACPAEECEASHRLAGNTADDSRTGRCDGDAHGIRPVTPTSATAACRPLHRVHRQRANGPQSATRFASLPAPIRRPSRPATSLLALPRQRCANRDRGPDDLRCQGIACRARHPPMSRIWSTARRRSRQVCRWPRTATDHPAMRRCCTRKTVLTSLRKLGIHPSTRPAQSAPCRHRVHLPAEMLLRPLPVADWEQQCAAVLDACRHRGPHHKLEAAPHGPDVGQRPQLAIRRCAGSADP